MIVLFAALSILAGPPRATIDGVPLAVSSWCWGTQCGAPLGASTRAVTAGRGATVRVRLAFEPTQVRVAVAGRRVAVSTHGTEVDWNARLGGGLTIAVSSSRGWVNYVGRLRVRS